MSRLLTSQFSWFTKYINHYKLVFAKLQELEKELCRLQQQLQISEEELRYFPLICHIKKIINFIKLTNKIKLLMLLKDCDSCDHA